MKPFRSKREKLGASNWRIQFLRGGLRPVGVTSVACVRASLLHSVRESPREDAILPLVTRHGALGGARGAEVQSVVPFGAQVLRPFRVRLDVIEYGGIARQVRVPFPSKVRA